MRIGALRADHFKSHASGGAPPSTVGLPGFTGPPRPAATFPDSRRHGKYCLSLLRAFINETLPRNSSPETGYEGVLHLFIRPIHAENGDVRKDAMVPNVLGAWEL